MSVMSKIKNRPDSEPAHQLYTGKISAFNVINSVILIGLGLICILPFWYIISLSLSSNGAVLAGQVKLFPVGLNFEAYRYVLEREPFWQAFGVTLKREFIGVPLNLLLGILSAYPLSKNKLKFRARGIYVWFFFFTMLFNGGMISTFIVVTKTLQLENTIWAMILPTAMSTYHLIIARTFMTSSIPTELHEAASIDGCNDFRFFFSMVLPLSGSLIATLVLMFGVMRWNSYFDALLYLTKQDRFPLQVFLRELLIQQSMANDTSSGADAIAQRQMADLIKYGIIIVSNVPVIVAYPFIQKYLVKGVLVGSIKG